MESESSLDLHDESELVTNWTEQHDGAFVADEDIGLMFFSPATCRAGQARVLYTTVDVRIQVGHDALHFPKAHQKLEITEAAQNTRRQIPW